MLLFVRLLIIFYETLNYLKTQTNDDLVFFKSFKYNLKVLCCHMYLLAIYFNTYPILKKLSLKVMLNLKNFVYRKYFQAQTLQNRFETEFCKIVKSSLRT